MIKLLLFNFSVFPLALFANSVIDNNSYNQTYIIEKLNTSNELFTKEELIGTALISSAITTIFVLLLFLYIRYRSIKSFKKVFIKELENKNEEIKELHKRLFIAADKALAGYWEWDLDSDELYFSKGWKEYLGFNENELKNNITTFKELLYPDDFEPTMRIVDEFLKGKTPTYKAQFRLRHKSGEYKWVNAVGGLSKKDNIFFGFHIDINDLITTKEMLIVQSKTATMGEMIQNIAHQWKQPLSLISTKVSGMKLQKELDSLTDEIFYNCCDSVVLTSQYLAHTIDDFKNYFKTDKEKSYFKLSDVINKANILLSAKSKRNSIEIIEKDSNIELYGLNNEWVQVVLNIINNAMDALIEHNKEKRVILIESNKLDEENFSLSILDNANGVPENIIDKIFDKHFTTKENNGGTGIGLYMSKHIIEEHLHGDISVENSVFVHENKEYKGACFKIEAKLNH